MPIRPDPVYIAGISYPEIILSLPKLALNAEWGTLGVRWDRPKSADIDHMAFMVADVQPAKQTPAASIRRYVHMPLDG